MPHIYLQGIPVPPDLSHPSTNTNISMRPPGMEGMHSVGIQVSLAKHLSSKMYEACDITHYYNKNLV